MRSMYAAVAPVTPNAEASVVAGARFAAYRGTGWVQLVAGALLRGKATRYPGLGVIAVAAQTAAAPLEQAATVEQNHCAVRFLRNYGRTDLFFVRRPGDGRPFSGGQGDHSSSRKAAETLCG